MAARASSYCLDYIHRYAARNCLLTRDLSFLRALVVSRYRLRCFSLYVVATAVIVTLVPLFGASRVRAGMKCAICHYEAREEGVSGHTARCCPLNNTECRATLPEDHPFHEPRPCLNANCEHLRRCNVCHSVGHTAAALQLSTCRWRLNRDGRAVPKVNTPGLTPSDFVCPLMTAASVSELLHFVHLLGK